jgi:membrane peptidoglycan carboxypeptidase
VLPNPIRFNPKGNQKYVKNRSRVILKTMQRRGVVDRAYGAVMSAKAPEAPLANELPIQEAEILPIELEAPQDGGGADEETTDVAQGTDELATPPESH